MSLEKLDIYNIKQETVSRSSTPSTRNNSPVTSSNSTPSTRQNSPFTRQSTPSQSPKLSRQISTRQNTLEENEQGDSDSDIRVEKDKIVIKINLKNINNQKTASKKRKKKKKKYKKSKEKSHKKNKMYSNVSLNIESNLKYSISSEQQGRSDIGESSLNTLGFNEQLALSTNPFAMRKHDGAIKINSGVIVNNTQGKYSLRNSGDMNARLSQKILELTHETLHMNYNNSLLTNKNNLVAKQQLSCTSVTQMKDSVDLNQVSKGFQNEMISNLSMLQQRRARLYNCKSVREMLLQSVALDDLQHTTTSNNNLEYLDRFNNNSKEDCNMNNIDSLGSLERLAEDCIDLTEEDAGLDNEFIDIHALETLIPYETYLQNIRNTENSATSNEHIVKLSTNTKADKLVGDPIKTTPKNVQKLGTGTSKTKTTKTAANVTEKRNVMSTETLAESVTNKELTKIKVPKTIRIDKTLCEIREIRPPPSPSVDTIKLIEPNDDTEQNELTHNQSNETCTNHPASQNSLQNAPSKLNASIKTLTKQIPSHMDSTKNEHDHPLTTNANETQSRNNEQNEDASAKKVSTSPLLRSQTKQSQNNSNVEDCVLNVNVKKNTKISMSQIGEHETSVTESTTSTEGLVLRSKKLRDAPNDGANTQSYFTDGKLAKSVILTKKSVKEVSDKSQLKLIKSLIGETRPQESPEDVENLNNEKITSNRQEIDDLSKETCDESKTKVPSGIAVARDFINPASNETEKSNQDNRTKLNATVELSTSSIIIVENDRDNLPKVIESGVTDLEQINSNESSSRETLFEALNLFKGNHLVHSKQKKQNEINNLLLEFDRLDSNGDGTNGNVNEAFVPILESKKNVMGITSKRNFDKPIGVEPLPNSTEQITTEAHFEQASVVNTDVESPLERALDMISKLDISFTLSLDPTSTSRLDGTSSHEQTNQVRETRKSDRLQKLKEPNMSMNETNWNDTETKEDEKRNENDTQKEDTVKSGEDSLESNQQDQEVIVSTGRETRKSDRIQKLLFDEDIPEDESTPLIVKTAEEHKETVKDLTEMKSTVKRKIVRLSPSEMVEESMKHIQGNKSDKNVDEVNDNGKKETKKVTKSRKANEKVYAITKSVENMNIDKDEENKFDIILRQNDINKFKRTSKDILSKKNVVSAKIKNIANKSETKKVNEEPNQGLECEQPSVTTRELRPRELRQTNEKRSNKKTKKKTKLESVNINAKSMKEMKNKVSKLGKGHSKTISEIDSVKSCTVSDTAQQLKRITRKTNLSNIYPTAHTSIEKLKKIARRSCSIEPKVETLPTSDTIETGFTGINRDSLRQSIRQSVDFNIEAEKRSSSNESKTGTICIETGFTCIINKDSLRQSVRQSIDSNIKPDKKKSYSSKNLRKSDAPIPNDAADAQTYSISNQTEISKPGKVVKNKMHVMLERTKKRRKRKNITKHEKEQILMSNIELNNNFILPLDFSHENEIKTETLSTKTWRRKKKKKDVQNTRSKNKYLLGENVPHTKRSKSVFMENKTKKMEVSRKISTKKSETIQPQRKHSSRFSVRKNTSMQRLRQSVRLLRKTSLKQKDRNVKNINKVKEESKTETKTSEKINKLLKKKDGHVSDAKEDSKKKQGKKENYKRKVKEHVNSDYKNENEVQRDTPTRTEIKKENSEIKQIKSEQITIVEIHNAITEQILKKKREKFNRKTITGRNIQAGISTHVETCCTQIEESIPDTGRAKRGRPLKDDSRLKLKLELVETNNHKKGDVYDFQDDQEIQALPPIKKHCKEPEGNEDILNEAYKNNKNRLNTRNSNVQECAKKKRGRPLKVVSEGLIKIKTELVQNNEFVQNNVYNYQDSLESIGTPLNKKQCKEEPGLTNSTFNKHTNGLIDDRDGRNSDKGNGNFPNKIVSDQQTAATHLTSVTAGSRVVELQSNPTVQITGQNKMPSRNQRTNLQVNKGNLYRIIQNIKSEIKEKNLIKTETTAAAASKSGERIDEKRRSNVDHVSQTNLNKDISKTHSDVNKIPATSGSFLDTQTYNQIAIEERDVEQSSDQFNAELLNSVKIKKEQLQYYASRANTSVTNLPDVKVDKKNFLQKCPLCEKIYRSPFRLKHHLRKVHGGQLFDCDCCNETFIDKQLYDEHMKSHDDGIDCKFCGGKFTKDNIKEHLVLHIQADMRGRINDGCFNKKQTSLLPHYLVRNGFKLQCHLCDDTFCPRSNMLRHYSTKHNEDKVYYTCERCSKRFSLLQNLKRHLAIHEGITYECRLCDRKYSRLSDYKMHLNIHNGMRYQCPICLKCTSRPSYLKKHMIMLHQRRDYNVLADPVGFTVDKKES
ncbi:hypothetical protein WDU94_006011 [Cyamophila willieti]